jgi:CrcB protein
VTKYLVIGLGGALGAIARYWLGALIGERFPTRFPLGTLLINVSGSFILGFFLTLFTERFNINPHLRLGMAVGFVGAYTTFSTFEYETFRLVETGSGLSGLWNIMFSVILGFLAVWGGIALAREVGTPIRMGDTATMVRWRNHSRLSNQTAAGFKADPVQLNAVEPTPDHTENPDRD